MKKTKSWMRGAMIAPVVVVGVLSAAPSLASSGTASDLRWYCKSHSDLEVTVWKNENRRLDDFEVHVTVGDLVPETLAVIDEVDAAVQDDLLIFAGHDGEGNRVNLTLDQSESVLRNVPATVKLWTKD